MSHYKGSRPVLAYEMYTSLATIPSPPGQSHTLAANLHMEGRESLAYFAHNHVSDWPGGEGLVARLVRYIS